MCGAKHAGTGAACAKKCIEGGRTPVFVDGGQEGSLTIDNPEAVKGFYGDHVTVTAKADEARRASHRGDCRRQVAAPHERFEYYSPRQ